MTNKMWGGRFKSGPDAIMQEINASIGFDKRLYAQDIEKIAVKLGQIMEGSEHPYPRIWTPQRCPSGT